jgi:hypothetical protein
MSATMFVRSARSGPSHPIALALLLALSISASPARATAPLLNQVNTIAAATTAVPVQETFVVASAGTYTITLTDLGATLSPPAPLASVTLAVTNSSDALVGNPLVGAGTLTLASLPAGTYELHVVGMPQNLPGSGPIGIQINGPSVTPATFEAVLALPAQPLPDGEGVLDDSFSVTSSGNYTLTLTDLGLPQNLTTLTLLLIAQGGATPVTTLAAAGSATVALSAGTTYDIFAIGAGGAPSNAGLYTVTVTNAGGSVIYGRAVPAGSVTHLGSVALAAGSATLTLTDLKYPAALTQLAAVATLTGQPAVQLSAAGAGSFTAVGSTYEVFAYAAAGTAAPGAGSYAVQVTQGSLAEFGVARAVVAPGSSESVYGFDSSITTAGTYTLGLADFQFPAALSTLTVGVVQAGALLGTPLTAAGTANLSASVGPISMFVFAQAATAGGLFGIDLTPQSGPAAFEATQAVGAAFNTQQIPIADAGSYAVTATDLGFPASFASYGTIVTQGTTAVGSIYGGGTFNFTASPGTYYVTFLAQPTGADEAGTYALTVAAAPPAPVVTLSVDNSQVSSGSTVDIIWSSQNATTCTASGGWSGAEPLSGTATSSALTADTTFTLTCTGPGGSQTKSVSVTVTGGGGGGSVDPGLLLFLFGLLCAGSLRNVRQSTDTHAPRTPSRQPRAARDGKQFNFP